MWITEHTCPKPSHIAPAQIGNPSGFALDVAAMTRSGPKNVAASRRFGNESDRAQKLRPLPEKNAK
jgi:hypothetical protein